MRKAVCRRCGKEIVISEYVDGGRLRMLRFNPDGSPHWCEIKICVSDKRLEWAKFNINVRMIAVIFRATFMGTAGSV